VHQQIGYFLATDQERRPANITVNGPLIVGKWWDVKDLNLRPKDSDLCNFRYSLDFAFIVAFALDGCRQVSTPSR
jgi:hypothetical protein